jgi:DNA-binding transcriptional MerR regulator
MAEAGSNGSTKDSASKDAASKDAASKDVSSKDPGAFRTIREVSEQLDVPQHVLRFWETRFPELKPLQRGGNRRYYRPADVAFASALHKLLHKDGYTVKGVRKLIADHGAGNLVAVANGQPAAPRGARLAPQPAAVSAAAPPPAAAAPSANPTANPAAYLSANPAAPLGAGAVAQLRLMRSRLAAALAH